MNTWEDALDRLDCDWCQGQGCTLGSVEQHQRGFTSYNPPTIHLTPEPDEKDAAGLHAALAKMGDAVAWETWPEMEGPERAVVAFDFATEQMRAHKLSVPKAVTEQRPEGETKETLFVGDKASEKEAKTTKGT